MSNLEERQGEIKLGGADPSSLLELDANTICMESTPAGTSRSLWLCSESLKRPCPSCLCERKGRDGNDVVDAAPVLSLPLSLRLESPCRMNTSQLALGLRRNLSNCATSDFGVTIMRDLAATTVLRAECKTGSALNAAMKAFCEDGLALMRQPAAEIEQEPQEPQELDLSNSEQPWSLSVIRIRCDATNSSIWKREELHVVEVVVSFLYSSIKLIAGKHTDCKSFMTTRPCLHLGLMSNLDFCQFSLITCLHLGLMSNLDFCQFSLIITTSPLTPLLNYCKLVCF